MNSFNSSSGSRAQEGQKEKIKYISFGITILFIGLLFCFRPSQANAATAIYRSVGPSATSSLATGASNAVTISSTTAVFTSPLPNNVGVGDAIQYDSDDNGTIDAVCFIHGRTNSTAYAVANAAGGAPATVSGDTNWSIFRAYTSLAAAEKGDENNSLDNLVEDFDNWDGAGDYTDTDEGGKDLVVADQVWNIALYANGNTSDTAAVIINGWTTDSTRSINIYTPNSFSEAGSTQRHGGVLDASKYHLSVSGTTVAVDNYANHVTLNGLQVVRNFSGSISNSGAIYNRGTGEFNLTNSIVKADWIGITSLTGSLRGLLVTTGTGTNNVWNNFIYDFSFGTSTTIYGISLESAATVYAYNNTVQGNYIAYKRAAGTFVAKNNIAQNCIDGFNGAFDASSDFNISDLAADAPGLNSKNSASVSFFDAANDNFHLAAGDPTAKDSGFDISASFVSDIDGDTRSDTWDIGADEYVAPDITPPSVDTFIMPASSTSLIVSVTGFTASDNVGVTGYLITESSSTPSIADPGWSDTVQASYVFISSGPKVLYAWARDAAANISESATSSVVVILPVFNIGGTVSGLTGTVVMQNNGGDDLSISANGSFAFNTPIDDGTSYAATIFSQPVNQTCAISSGSGTVSGSDVTDISVACIDNDISAPLVNTFVIPATSVSLNVSVTDFTATDNTGITGYLITESSSTPLVSDPNWSGSAQASYIFSAEGARIAYAWAKDAAGNISLSLSASINIGVPPSISSSSPSGSLSSLITTTTLSITTDEDATCKYGTMAGIAYGLIADTFSSTGGTSHSVVISGLSSGNSYRYYIRCQDANNNANSSDYQVYFYVGDWRAPKGMPDPADYFSTFGKIDKATPPWPESWLTSSTTATSSYYFVDNSDVSCTDSGNTYGHPDLPRCLPPEGNLAAGTYLYFHGGSYADGAGPNLDWHGSGTADNPIWITGNPGNNPVFSDTIAIGYNGNASYLIIENITMSGTEGIDIRPTTNGNNVDHLIIRNSTFTGTASDPDGGAIGIGPTGPDVTPSSTVQYVVVYNVNISNYGYIGESGVGGEETGVYQGYHTDYVWVLDSVIHHVGADSIAGSHTANATTMTAEHYFIGRNTLYQNGENCVDLKTINHVIVSENVCYGPHQDENGWGMVFHYGANSIPTKNLWVLFNKIYDTYGGISLTSVENAHIVGNVIYNQSIGNTSDPLNGNGVGFRGTTGEIDIVDNSIYGTSGGIRCNQTLATGTVLNIYGNIISSRTDDAGYEIRIDGGSQHANIDYNQLYYASGTAAVYWNGASRNLAYMQSTAGECLNCAEGDPLFVSPVENFGLRISSPAKDANIENSVYDVFFAAYGIDIEKDMAGISRPQNSLWDMGAYEQNDTVSPVITAFVIPPAAASLTVGISIFAADDNIGVTGYLLTESSSTPILVGPSWSGTVPTEYVFSADGTKTIYAWARDAAGNISSSVSDSVTITLPTYTIGGTVSGLSDTVVLQNNGGDDLTVSENGAFTFVMGTTTGASYAVTVFSQPSGETCLVTNGSGTISSFDVTDISVSCVSGGAADAIAPVRSAGLPSGSQQAGITQISMSLTTDENATCKYSTIASTSYGSMTDSFLPAGGTSHSAVIQGLVNGQSYSYYVRCQDGSNNANSDDYVISFSVSSPVVSGGGTWITSAPAPSASSANTLAATSSLVATTSPSAEPADDVRIGDPSVLVDSNLEAIIKEAAETVAVQIERVPLRGITLAIYEQLSRADRQMPAFPESERISIARFIHFGTPTTLRLGPGERAGVLYSYRQAFGKLPQTEAEWQDVIKIANGRWTKNRSAKAESDAKNVFKLIYKRNADLKNNLDENALMVMAYGLRPANRNFGSERAAILTFGSIFKKAPQNPSDWDAVRSVAYSGARR